MMENEIEQLITKLQDPSIYPHAVNHVELIETHISWVFLAGEYVYKIKKPVNLGFLDFSTLEKRHQFCELEVQLNKRLAPEYYLGVIAISGSFQQPEIENNKNVIEYAVKMRQFPQQTQLDRVLAEGKLTFEYMDLLATKIADFHQTIQVADSDSCFGDLSHVHTPVVNCFTQIFDRLLDNSDVRRVQVLKDWSEDKFESLKEQFDLRKSQGFVRECHGDLHLRNIAIHDDEVIAFDGIEFSEDLRWNDVMSEIAFLVMDLEDHGQFQLASRFLNSYLELTGDYQGLSVFQYYLVYRAIVRAMVSIIRLSQNDINEAEAQIEKASFQNYLGLAENYITSRKPQFFITHGYSGSGKSRVSRTLMQEYPAIRIRSDVERKRLFGMAGNQRDKQGIQQGIYGSAISLKTYELLTKLALDVVNFGYSVIVDAAFLKKDQRQKFIELAAENQMGLVILSCDASVETIKQRLIKRQKKNKDVSDADIRVFEHQLENSDPLSKEERSISVLVNAENVMEELAAYKARIKSNLNK